MTYKEFVRSVAFLANSHVAEAERTVAAVVTTIHGRTLAGDRVRIPGLGTFALKETPARAGRNPRTGEPAAILARQKLRFRPAKSRLATNAKE